MHDSLQAIISSPSLIREEWLSPDMAVQEVMAFKQHFGPKHLLLACHASLPWILHPELLNLIRINFLDNQSIPWVAEADFLLSSLCRPHGNDLFEVEPGIREVLLVKLENETNWQRPLELAKFLQIYLTKKSHWKEPPDVIRTQWWIAQAYIDPDSVIEEMTNVLEKSLSSEGERAINLPSQIQVATTLEIAADPLERANSRVAYQYLVNNSRVLTQILYGESQVIRRQELGDAKVEKEAGLVSPIILKWLTEVGEAPEQVSKEESDVKLVDYHAAIPMFVPREYVFPGYEGHTPRFIVLHKTASGGTAQDIAHFFATAPGKRSVHYVVGQDGTVVQCVSESDGAGGNCCLDTGHDAFWPTDINLNLITISISHCDPTSDNSTPLTDAQKTSSFALIADICKRHGIPPRAADANGGIAGHHSIAPLSRYRCPGNYPWNELWTALSQEIPMSIEKHETSDLEHKAKSNLVLRLLVADIPQSVNIDDSFSMLVYLTASSASETGASLPIALPVGETVDIVIQAQRGFSLEEKMEGSLVNPDAQETPPLQFKLRGVAIGPGQLRVLAFHQGQPLGALTLNVTVLEASSADILPATKKGRRKRATPIGRGDFPKALLRGSTLHCNVYYDPNLSANGRMIADGVLGTSEADYNTLSDWFGGITPPGLPFNIIISARAWKGWGLGGAYHYGCAGTDIYCDAKTTPNLDIDYTRFMAHSQEVEVFAAAQGLGWDCGASNGEGLSRVLATELYPAALNGFATAAIWLDTSDRPDFITNNPTSSNLVSTGCSVLFLNYLHYQLGFTWKQIMQAGAPTLAQTYTKLTGQPDALTPFKALLQASYPLGTPSGVTTDNVFPLEEPSKVASTVLESARKPRVIDELITLPSVNSSTAPKSLNSEAFYNALLSLDYQAQVFEFRRFLKISHMGAFLITGEPGYGQRWLLNRLVREIPEFAHTVSYKFNLGSLVGRLSLETIWSQLARSLLLTRQQSPDRIVEQVLKLLQTQNFVLIFEDVKAIDEHFLQEIIEGIWRRLVWAAQNKIDKSQKNYLLIFFIDNTGVAERFPFFAEQLHEIWNPQIPIKLRKISRFTNDTLTSWLKFEAVALPSHLTISDILEGTEGIPERVLERICDIYGYDWHEIESKWMNY